MGYGQRRYDSLHNAKDVFLELQLKVYAEICMGASPSQTQMTLKAVAYPRQYTSSATLDQFSYSGKLNKLHYTFKKKNILKPHIRLTCKAGINFSQAI